MPFYLSALRNASQWRAVRTGAARAEVSSRLRALEGGPLVIITGSCGLDLLHCGWVAGACRVVTVIDRRDLLSRALHRSRAHIRVPCGYMGYRTCPERGRPWPAC